MSEVSRLDITVVGAGVIGLTVAYQLAALDRYNVKVVAKSLPIDPSLDYTSQYAGANWRSVCSNTDYQMIAFEEATLQYFRDFSNEHPELVNKCMGFDVFDPRDPDVNDKRTIRKHDVIGGELPWFQRICPKFAVMPTDSLRKCRDSI